MRKFQRTLAVLLVVCMLIPFTAGTAGATPQKQMDGKLQILDLTVNNRTDPEGIDTENPSFGWRMDSNLIGQKQTAYQIEVKEKQSGRIVWDSGKVTGNKSQYISYAGEKLEPEADYLWQVSVYDKNDVACHSGTALFSTGLMAERLQEIDIEAIKDLTSFTVDIDFTIYNGCLGLLLGVQDSNNFLMWQVNAKDLRINPHRWENGGLNQNYAHPSISEALGTDTILNRPMHMTVQVKTGIITTWIDGKEIGDPVSVGKLTLGRLGFRQMDNEAADVDEITVRTEDGKIVFQDSFDDPSVVHFNGGTLEDGKLKMNNSRLVFQNEDNSKGTTSFTIDLDAILVNDAFGFVFGAKDTGNFFMWQLNAKYAAYGKLRPHRWNGGGVSEFTSSDLNQVFGDDGKITGTPVHMKIDVDNGVIKTYMGVDGQNKLVSTVTVEPFDLGKIGFRQHREGEDDEIGMVDNIKVTAKDGTILFEDDFSDITNPNFPSGVVTDEGWLRVENALFFQNVKETDIPGWSGAQWIGAPDISLDSSKVPVFNVSYTMQLLEGSTKASALLCANDPRLLDKTRNDYRVAGENYLSLELDASGLLESPSAPAVLNVYRKGVSKDDYKNPDATTLLGSYRLENIGLTKETIHQPLQFIVSAYGGGLRININSRSICQIVTNPTGATQDVPCYTYMNSIGFMTEAGQKADFSDYVVQTWDAAKAIIWSKNVGATYAIFNGVSGVAVDGNILHVGSDFQAVKALADPSYGTTPMLRKQINAYKEIEKARLYVTARGIYEMSVNGERIGQDWFNPGYTQYNKTITYSTYDVTDKMAKGENVIGARLASGWWCDEMTFDLSKYNYFGNKPSLLAKIVITYTDGTQDTVVTDPSWRYNNSDNPVTYAGFFNGETYDARKEAEVAGWDSPGFNAGNWPVCSVLVPLSSNANPRIAARTDEPVRHVQTLPAKFDKETDPNVYVYDMGTNMAGVPEIKFPEGKAGQEITIRYAEIYYPELDPGNRYYYGELSGKLLFENLRAALCTDTYIMKGTPGGETYRPRFTFHGYRYIQISGLDAPLPAENIKGIVLSSIEETTSTYESSNALTNQLHQNIQRSLFGNHISIPTDCPQRDERMGWTGDAQVFSRTATYYGNLNLFYEGWESSIRDAQGDTGWVPDVIPNAGFGVGAAVAWPAAIVIPTWETYKQYGNTRLVKDHLEAMKAFLDAVGSDKNSSGTYLTRGTALTEHLALIGTDSPLCSNVLYAYMLDIFSRMADAVGEKDIARTYGDLAVKVKEEWNRTFINAASGKTQNAGGGIQDTQASYALAIEYGVISDANREKAAGYLAEACKRGFNNVPYTITTGFIGTAPLLPALTASGKVDEAYKMFEQTEYASWLYPVTQGATSIWERWNGYTIENGFSGLNYMNSFNHYAAGAVGAWMMNYHIGIISDQDNPGFSHFILQPTPGGDFTFVNGGYDSSYGHIASNWKADQGKLTSYQAVVPANTTATLYLPVDSTSVTALTEIEGVTYVGTAKRNSLQTAQFTLEAGGYQFDITDGKLSVSMLDGYTTEGSQPALTDKSALEASITAAEAYEGKSADYTVESFKSFTDALDDANQVFVNDNATQKEADDAAAALNTAMELLKPLIISVEAPTSVSVYENFVITVTTAPEVTGLQLFNEVGTKMGVTVAAKPMADGNKIWEVTYSIGTRGEGRTFTLAVKKDSDTAVLTNHSFTLDVLAAKPAEPVTLIQSANFGAGTARVNESMTLTVVTDPSVSKIGVYNETGGNIGMTGTSKKDADGVRTWTLTFSAGTKGERTFTVKGITASGASTNTVTACVTLIK